MSEDIFEQKNSGSYEQNFRQGVMQEVAIEAAKKQADDKKKKHWIIIFIALVTMACIITVITMVIINFNSNNKTTNDGRTALTNFYEEIGDEVSFGELENKIRETVPDAKKTFEDGEYLIGVDGADDYISCHVKSELENEAEVDMIEEIDLDNLIAEILARPDSELDEDDEEYGEPDQLEINPDLPPSTMLTDFVYYIYEDNKDGGDASLLSVSKNGNEYDYSIDGNIVTFQNKSDAVNALFR